MPFSQAIDNSVLNHFTTKSSWADRTANATYIGMCNATPTKTAGGTEPSGGAYARQQITAANFDSAVASAVTTNAIITFPTATADWLAGVNMNYFVLFDAVTAGNYLGYIPITTPKSVLNNDTVKILANELDLVIA